MRAQFLAALDACAETGQPARFWLRDDDAVAPGAALDRLLAVAAGGGVPLTLAVIPAFAGPPLADRLAGLHGVHVAPHGWAHVNHAAAGEKKQELGTHRAVEVVLAELRAGRSALDALFGAQALPVLVPPWNRIAPDVAAGLPAAGFRALSVFGPEAPADPPRINTHVDLMDWHGTRGGRPDEALFADLLAAMAQGRPVGFLTHHLVHDAQAWAFLDQLVRLTAGHPGARWMALPDLLDAATA